MYDYAIIGGGILGLATAAALAEQYPGCHILVIEKEDRFAAHQTGRNSGVIHSGIYYKPGSLKAQLAVVGNRSLQEYCERRNVPYRICGKLIVATRDRELPFLEQLFARGIENQVPVSWLTPEQVYPYEPHVACVAALRVASTGITNYRAVCHALIEDLRHAGADLRTGTEVLSSTPAAGGHRLETTCGSVATRFLIACAGLQSDRVAARCGTRPQARIVPFRGEYYELRPERRHLVNGLVYPVANPSFPFLGVHFTRGIDGSVHAGPNAVLALKREGYSKRSFDMRDALDTLTYSGFWKLAARYWHEGSAEMLRSTSKTLFTRELQQIVPEVREEDLVPAESGVRAQALAAAGSLLDDFVIQRDTASLFVLNAPSPAATASLAIARYIVNQVPQPRTFMMAVRASA